MQSISLLQVLNMDISKYLIDLKAKLNAQLDAILDKSKIKQEKRDEARTTMQVLLDLTNDSTLGSLEMKGLLTQMSRHPGFIPDLINLIIKEMKKQRGEIITKKASEGPERVFQVIVPPGERHALNMHLVTVADQKKSINNEPVKSFPELSSKAIDAMAIMTENLKHLHRGVSGSTFTVDVAQYQSSDGSSTAVPIPWLKEVPVRKGNRVLLKQDFGGHRKGTIQVVKAASIQNDKKTLKISLEPDGSELSTANPGELFALLGNESNEKLSERYANIAKELQKSITETKLLDKKKEGETELPNESFLLQMERSLDSTKIRERLVDIIEASNEVKDLPRDAFDMPLPKPNLDADTKTSASAEKNFLRIRLSESATYVNGLHHIMGATSDMAEDLGVTEADYLLLPGLEGIRSLVQEVREYLAKFAYMKLEKAPEKLKDLSPISGIPAMKPENLIKGVVSGLWIGIYSRSENDPGRQAMSKIHSDPSHPMHVCVSNASKFKSPDFNVDCVMDKLAENEKREIRSNSGKKTLKATLKKIFAKESASSSFSSYMEEDGTVVRCQAYTQMQDNRVPCGAAGRGLPGIDPGGARGARSRLEEAALRSRECES